MERLMSALIAKMRHDIAAYPLRLEFVVMERKMDVTGKRWLRVLLSVDRQSTFLYSYSYYGYATKGGYV
jgi:hypothetical protein